MQAPGEGEALCAVLNAEQLVDAVQSVDVDALVFGAETVYKALELQVLQPRNAELVRCEMSAIRAALGIRSGKCA